MECFDHYPWDDAQRADLLNTICDALALISPPPPIPPARFVKFGDAMICTVCQLDVRYCRGHAPVAVPAQDGAESSLERRVRACMGGR